MGGNISCCFASNDSPNSKGSTSLSPVSIKNSLRLIPKDKALASSLKIGPNIFVSLKEGAIGDYYELGEHIADGGFGTVHKVIHKKTGLERVLKTIYKARIPQDEEESLLLEACTLKELDHPNIHKLYELYQDEEHYMLIFEYCRGGELFDRIKACKFLPEKQVADYMKQLLSAVAYCHSKNIVHRDLKPENLMLDSTDSNANLKVIDFGTSRFFRKGQAMTNEYGTCYYIAPEVLDRNYDEKCDVWSCGVIMYIMLCGYPPFNGPDDEAIFRSVKKGVVHFPEKGWSGISEQAKDLIRKMLEIDPKQRISAQEAISTPWVQENSKNLPICDYALKNLREFRPRTKLHQAILTFIASEITTQQEKEELLLTFRQLDTDGSGTLSTEDLIEGYIKLYGDRKRAESEVQQILTKTDLNNSGEIEFTEFLLASMRSSQLLSKEKIEKAFKLFDLDEDGYISKDEFSKVMGGIELPESEWLQLIREFHNREDSKITLEDFSTALARRRKSSTESASGAVKYIDQAKSLVRQATL